jgi:hypothetical protein
MKESEKVLEKMLVRKVKQLGGMCIKLETNYMAGLPDRLCLLPKAKIFFVEVKSTGETPDPIQRVIHKMLRRIGFTVYVADTSSLINKIIDDERN